MSSESLQAHLGSAIPCLELLMSAWEALQATNPHVKPWIEVGLDWATRYYKRMDETRAYAVAMCKFQYYHNSWKSYIFLTVVDPAVRMKWIRSYWDSEYMVSAEEMVLKLVS